MEIDFEDFCASRKECIYSLTDGKYHSIHRRHIHVADELGLSDLTLPTQSMRKQVLLSLPCNLISLEIHLELGCVSRKSLASTAATT